MIACFMIPMIAVHSKIWRTPLWCVIASSLGTTTWLGVSIGNAWCAISENHKWRIRATSAKLRTHVTVISPVTLWPVILTKFKSRISPWKSLHSLPSMTKPSLPTISYTRMSIDYSMSKAGEHISHGSRQCFHHRCTALKHLFSFLRNFWSPLYELQGSNATCFTRTIGTVWVSKA